jgi:imidazolonepropionase-like amidohydrolase
MTTKMILQALLLCCIPFLATGQDYKFVNGKWFTGKTFKPMIVYSSNGKLTFSNSRKSIIEEIDLKGMFIIPPFGDAHTHNFGTTYNLDKINKQYLKEGIFYVLILGAPTSGKVQVLSTLEHSLSPELHYATGGLTCTLGHPFLHYEPRAMGLHNPAEWNTNLERIAQSRIMADNAYWFLDNKQDVDSKWEMIVETQPAYIKIFLLDVNNHESNFFNKKQLGGKGLSKEVAEYVMKKSKASGFQVIAHVETADDLRFALQIGVNGIAHLPGYNWDGIRDPEMYKLNDQDYKKMKRSNVFITPTLTFSKQFTAAASDSIKSKVKNFHRQALKKLITNKIPVAIGSDQFEKSSGEEMDYFYKNKMVENLQLLRWATVTTPKVIFPNRKIGVFKEGFEASFLALEKNPLEDFSAIDEIGLYVKQGEILPIK